MVQRWNSKVDGRDDEDHCLYNTSGYSSRRYIYGTCSRTCTWRKYLATDETREAVEEYIFESSMRSNVDRMQDKEKTGVFTGSYAINPIKWSKGTHLAV